MVSKIRIKFGEVEIEYEGSEEFLKAELPQFLQGISQLYQELHPLMGQEELDSVDQPEGETGGKLVGTTGTIASKLGCQTGPELLIAAAARLTIGLAREDFSRQELLKEAQSAKAYYKANVGKNLSNYLLNLVKGGKLNEVSSERYALTAGERSRIEALLGNS